MKQASQLFLYLTIVLWATLAGGVAYSHIVYFPPYLGHLPESTALITGPYGLHEEAFWKMLHPLLIVSVVVTAILNWKRRARRKYILIAVIIYALAIVSTAVYFVPELIAFSKSSTSPETSAAEWLERGQRWQHLSWVRGLFVYLGFVLLLVALAKDNGNKELHI